MRWTLLCTLLFIAAYNVHAQQNYWQQQVDYVIEVTLDDDKHILRGKIQMTYHNHAPHALDSIYMHLWPNAFSSQESAFAEQMLDLGKLDFYDADRAHYGSIDSLDFTVNNGKQEWTTTNEPDIGLLLLENPIAPGEQVTITTPFRVKIPHSFSRLGHTGQAYQLTQWFPKPAVYDQDGHHPMPYLHIGEFYSEFGSFDVKITLPANYVVGATGELQNEEELRWMKEKAAITRAQLRHADSLEKNFTQHEFPPSSDSMKTLYFKANNVHDFAWFADKRYHVMMDTSVLPSGKEIPLYAMFTNLEATLWKNATIYIDSSLLHYSRLVGDYPYPQCTVVEGALSAGAGMEYPMVTIIGQSGFSRALERVIVHEVGHNWFYGILGFNERIHPWMDEGINSYYEYRYFDQQAQRSPMLPEKLSRFIRNAFGLPGVNQAALMDIVLQDQQITGNDQPAGLPAHHYPQFNYALDVYHKPARYLEHLAAYLGEENFDRAMQTFYEQWKFKHPGPADLQQSLEQSSGKELDWLFDDLIEQNKTINHKLQVDKHDSGFDVSIQHRGGASAPTHLAALKDGEIIWEQWVENADTSFAINKGKEAIDAIELDPHKVTTETNRQNDFYQPNKLFKRATPLVPHLLGSVEQQHKKMFYLMPAGGWNAYDGTYLGLGIYNNLIPRRGFHFLALPAFSFDRDEWVGAATLEHNFYFDNEWLRRIRLGITGQTFNETNREEMNIKYQIIAPSVTAIFDKLTPASHFSHEVRYRYIDVNYKFSNLQPNATYKFPPEYAIHALSYKIENDYQLLPWESQLTLEVMDGATKLFSETGFNFRSNTLDGNIELRLFGGVFLDRPPADFSFPEEIYYTLSNRPGYLDYRYDELFLGRRHPDGFFYQQQVESDGGFKVRTDNFPFGQNSQWLASANLSIPLPIPILPIRVFADAAIVPGTNSPEFHAETGVSLRLIKDVVEIYFPIAMTQQVKQAFLSDTDNYWQRITFQLNFSKLNPVRLLREARISQ